MKKIPVIFCAASMIFLLCSCRGSSQYDYYSSYPSGSIPQEELDFSPEATVISTPLPSSTPVQAPAAASAFSAQAQEAQQNQVPIRTPTPTVAPPAASEAAQTAVPSASASPAPTTYLANEIQITKSPTSETVYTGGSALFIAKAENATSTNWITVSPDAKTSYRIQDAPSHFNGLTVEGQGTANLRLSNIPASMSGWRIQCYFTGEGGPKYTNGAYLTVLSDIPGPFDPSSPSVPSSEAESRVSSLAVTTGQQLYSTAINTYGYTSVTDITNYAYSSNQATYSMIFTSSNYKIIGQFRSYFYSSSNTGSEPMYAYIYDSAGTSIRGENLSGQSFDYFFTILDQYK